MIINCPKHGLQRSATDKCPKCEEGIPTEQTAPVTPADIADAMSEYRKQLLGK